MKKVYIIHGWGGTPEEPLLVWLGTKLQEKGCEVVTPAMPNKDEPDVFEWTEALKKVVGSVDENTCFVGHSIGAQTIMRMLADLPDDTRMGGALFIAGWFEVVGLLPEEEEIVRPWIKTTFDLEKVKSRGRVTVVLSDNDPFVPLAVTKEKFEKDLGARVVVERGKGHFTEESNIREDEVVLKECEAMLAE